MNWCYELRLTRPFLSEAMLLVTKELMTVNVLHEMAVDYVLHGLGTDRSQRNRTIVGLALISLLE